MTDGAAGWLTYIWVLIKEIGAYFFVPGSGHFEWRMMDNEWQLVSAELPKLSANGKDIIDSLMTIIHNILIYLAQSSVLLPANTSTN